MGITKTSRFSAAIRRGLTMSVCVGALGATALVGAGPAMAVDKSAGTTAGTHKPATIVQPKNCDVIPPDADDNVLRVLRDIGNQRGINDKVRLSMFEAAWVESHANNLPCGDADSLGVFQQRPSQGWCDPASLCNDVPHATNKYLDQAIPNDQNNPGFTAGQLAQSVQRSAYPERYDQEEGKARELIDRSNGL